MNNNLYLFPILFFILFYIFHIFSIFIKLKILKNPILLIFFSLLLLPIYFIFFDYFDIIISYQEFIYLSCFYFLIVILYIHLYVGFLKSVSIRIIFELDKIDQKQINFHSLKKIYSYNELINNRISSLIKNKWIYNEVNFKCAKKSIILVKINLFFKKIYRLKNTG